MSIDASSLLSVSPTLAVALSPMTYFLAPESLTKVLTNTTNTPPSTANAQLVLQPPPPPIRDLHYGTQRPSPELVFSTPALPATQVPMRPPPPTSILKSCHGNMNFSNHVSHMHEQNKALHINQAPFCNEFHRSGRFSTTLPNNDTHQSFSHFKGTHANYNIAQTGTPMIHQAHHAFCNRNQNASPMTRPTNNRFCNPFHTNTIVTSTGPSMPHPLEQPPRCLRYILDLDGFVIQKCFLAKEMAVCDLFTGHISLHRFKVGDYKQLSMKARRQVTWVRNHIHGLDFCDLETDLPQIQMQAIVEQICKTATENNELIGYKGGHYEYDLLNSLGYSNLACNIEILGCPRLEVLIESYPPPCIFDMDPTNKATANGGCPHHKTIQNPHQPHCPRLEVAYFRNYIYEMSASQQRQQIMSGSHSFQKSLPLLAPASVQNPSPLVWANRHTYEQVEARPSRREKSRAKQQRETVKVTSF